MNQNWPTNGKMRNEKIMSYKMKAFVCFENTMIQTDSEKISCIQKIEDFSRYFCWNFETSEKLLLTQIIFMYVTKKCNYTKIRKST